MNNDNGALTIAHTNGEGNGDALLQIKDLHVWYELKRFGFGHAGYVRAVDGVTFDLRPVSYTHLTGRASASSTRGPSARSIPRSSSPTWSSTPTCWL